MGFEINNKVIGKIPKEWVDEGPPSLSLEETMFLLNYIKNSEFKGAQLEPLFNVTIKLQKIYTYWGEKKTSS